MNLTNKIVIASDFETQNIFSNDLKIKIPQVVAFSLKEIYQVDNDQWKDILYTEDIDLKQVIKECNKETYYYDNYGENVLNDFFDYLFRTYKNYKFVDIYFHNFRKFDGQFLISYLLSKFKFTLKAKRPKQWSWVNTNNSILELTLISEHNTKFIFKDTLNHFPTSIKNMGEMIGLSKLEVNQEADYNIDLCQERTNNTQLYKDYVKYTIRDTDILAKFIKLYTYESGINFNTTMTSAGLAMKQVKHHTDKDYYKYFTINDYTAWNLLNMGYYGGFCMLNDKHRGVIIKNIEYYDINSAYPFQMTEELPVGEPLWKEPSFEHLKYFIVKIKSGTIKQHLVPIIRVPKQNAVYKKEYEINKFLKNIKEELVYGVWEQELEYFKKFYNDFDYEITSTIYFRKGFPLKELISKQYKERNHYKQLMTNTDNPVEKIANSMKQTAKKNVLNSTYGKLGEKIVKPIQVIVPFSSEELKTRLTIYRKGNDFTLNGTKYEKDMKENAVSDYVEYNIQTISQSNVHIINGQHFTQISIINEQESIDNSYSKQRKEHTFKNVGIASYITMKTRITLFKEIYQQGEDFVYCDTDSIITKGEFKGEIDKNKLGAWKLESVKNYFLGRGSKQYILSDTPEFNKDTKFTISGYNDFSQLMGKTFDNVLEEGISLNKLSAKRLPTGTMLVEKNSTLSFKKGIYET